MHSSRKKRTKSKRKKNSCIQACMLIQKIHMHSYMHSSKILKQKKIKFYAFINAFFFKKKEQYQKGKNNSCIQACIFIQKIHKTSRIIKCIFQKKKEQNQKDQKKSID